MTLARLSVFGNNKLFVMSVRKKRVSACFLVRSAFLIDLSVPLGLEASQEGVVPISVNINTMNMLASRLHIP